MKIYTLNDTAKEIRATLKTQFPGTKFSVCTKSYSMGCSIAVSWIDGPPSKSVQSTIEHFGAKTFDGMTDSSGRKAPINYKGEMATFSNDYVMYYRTLSESALRKAAEIICAETGCEMPEIKPAQTIGKATIEAHIASTRTWLTPFKNLTVEEAIYQHAGQTAF